MSEDLTKSIRVEQQNKNPEISEPNENTEESSLNDIKIDLSDVSDLIARAEQETNRLKTAVIAASFTKEEYYEMLKQRDISERSIPEIAKQYEEQISEDLNKFEYPFELKELDDDLFVLNEITKDKNYKNQEVLNLIRRIFDLENEILESERLLKNNENSEVQKRMDSSRNTMSILVEKLRQLIEQKRSLLIKEYVEIHNNFQNEKYERIKRPLQSASDRIRNHKKILKEIREKLTDPIIRARIQAWEEQEELDNIIREMNELSDFIEGRNNAIEKVAQIQERIISKILSMMQISDEEKEDLRDQIYAGNITMDINYIRSNIAAGILRSPKKVEESEIFPWRTGGLVGEKYYDLLNYLNSDGIREDELKIFLDNPNLEIGRGRTSKTGYEKASEHIDLLDKVNNINKSLFYILGKKEYFNRTTGKNETGVIYSALNARNVIKDEDFPEFLKNLNENAQRIVEERRKNEERLIQDRKEKEEIFEIQLNKLKEMGAIEFQGYLVLPEKVSPKRGTHKDEKGIIFRIFLPNEDQKNIQEISQISEMGIRLRANQNYYPYTIPEAFKYLFENK